MNSQNKSDLWEKVNKALDEIRPYLNDDGGDVTLIEITAGMVVKVELKGACSTCPISNQTLKFGIEQAIKKSVPSIKKVIAVEKIS